MASMSVEKFGVRYLFDDDGEFVTIKVNKPEPDDWIGEMYWPAEDLLSLYHALGDFLMFSSRLKKED